MRDITIMMRYMKTAAEKAKAQGDYFLGMPIDDFIALVEALETAQEYAKKRDEENQDLMLTVGRLRIEREAQKKLIGWRTTDYTMETSNRETAQNWAAAVGVLPIFEGDVNTILTTYVADIKD